MALPPHTCSTIPTVVPPTIIMSHLQVKEKKIPNAGRARSARPAFGIFFSFNYEYDMMIPMDCNSLQRHLNFMKILAITRGAGQKQDSQGSK